MEGLEAVAGVGQAESDLTYITHPPGAVHVILGGAVLAGLAVGYEGWHM